MILILAANCFFAACERAAEPVDPPPPPKVAVDDERVPEPTVQTPAGVSLAEVEVKIPPPEKGDLTWEKIFFRSIHQRERLSNLTSLRSKPVRPGDIELRVWSGFGITALQGFVLKREAGVWSAVDLDWEVLDGRNGTREMKPVANKLDAPRSGWEPAWLKLVQEGILNMPSAEKIDCSGRTEDGISFVVEYRVQNEYRTYLYDNPQYAKCDEAKQFIRIVGTWREEFYGMDYAQESR